MMQWKAELWYSDNLLAESTVSARDLRDATEAAFLWWRQFEVSEVVGASLRGKLELADRIVVSLLRV